MSPTKLREQYDWKCLVVQRLTLYRIRNIAQGRGRFNPLTSTVAIMATAIKHAVPDRVKPPFVIFDIRAL